MRNANRWKSRILLGALAALVGCDTQDASLTSPVSGDPANQAFYAFSTPYGDMWDNNGEQVPAGYGQPWDAQIFDRNTSIDLSSCRDTGCNVHFDAYMKGLWHITTQSIHWTVNGSTGTAVKSGAFGSCVARISWTYCAALARTDAHEVWTDSCAVSAKGYTDHAASWGAWFDLLTFGMKTSPLGRTESSSIAADKSSSACAPGGDSLPGSYCYDFFLTWTDWVGYHEEFVGSVCYTKAPDAT